MNTILCALTIGISSSFSLAAPVVTSRPASRPAETWQDEPLTPDAQKQLGVAVMNAKKLIIGSEASQRLTAESAALAEETRKATAAAREQMGKEESKKKRNSKVVREQRDRADDARDKAAQQKTLIVAAQRRLTALQAAARDCEEVRVYARFRQWKRASFAHRRMITDLGNAFSFKVPLGYNYLSSTCGEFVQHFSANLGEVARSNPDFASALLWDNDAQLTRIATFDDPAACPGLIYNAVCKVYLDAHATKPLNRDCMTALIRWSEKSTLNDFKATQMIEMIRRENNLN